jgi:hypothetical protein
VAWHSAATQQSVARHGAATQQSVARHSTATQQSVTRHSAATQRSVTRHSAATQQSVARHSAATQWSVARHSAATQRSVARHSATTQQSVARHSVAAQPNIKRLQKLTAARYQSAVFCHVINCPQKLTDSVIGDTDHNRTIYRIHVVQLQRYTYTRKCGKWLICLSISQYRVAENLKQQQHSEYEIYFQ